MPGRSRPRPPDRRPIRGGRPAGLRRAVGRGPRQHETVMLNDSLYVREALSAGCVRPPAAPSARRRRSHPAARRGGLCAGPPVVPASSALANAGYGKLAFPLGAGAGRRSGDICWTQGSIRGAGSAATAMPLRRAARSPASSPAWTVASTPTGWPASPPAIPPRPSASATRHAAGSVPRIWPAMRRPITARSLRSAAATSFSALDTTRSLAFPGFSNSATARYGATTTQIFGEAGYRRDVRQIVAEPSAGLAFAHLSAGGFAENGGGVAALSGSPNDLDIGYSTLGGQGRARLSPGQRHVADAARLGRLAARIGSLTPTETLTFRNTGGTSRRRPADRARYGAFRGRARFALRFAGRGRTVLFRPIRRPRHQQLGQGKLDLAILTQSVTRPRAVCFWHNAYPAETAGIAKRDHAAAIRLTPGGAREGASSHVAEVLALTSPCGAE